MPGCSVAVDESGRHGSNLVAGGAFILGSTSLNDSEAAALLRETLGPPPQTAREWKWRLAKGKRGLKAFLESLSPHRVLAVAIHHRFFGWCKAVDTLLYEYPVVVLGAPGSDEKQLVTVGLAYATWEEVRTMVDPFVSAWIDAVGSPDETSLLRLRGAARTLRDSISSSQDAVSVMDRMTYVVEHLSPRDVQQLTLGSDHGDPHIPAAGTLISVWAERLRATCPMGFSLLHDEIKQGDVIDRWAAIFERVGVEVSRGSSQNHPALQVADIVAGATRTALANVDACAGGNTQFGLAPHVSRWLPTDMTIWPWADPGSALRPEGTVELRSDPDR